MHEPPRNGHTALALCFASCQVRPRVHHPGEPAEPPPCPGVDPPLLGGLAPPVAGELVAPLFGLELPGVVPGVAAGDAGAGVPAPGVELGVTVPVAGGVAPGTPFTPVTGGLVVAPGPVPGAHGVVPVVPVGVVPIGPVGVVAVAAPPVATVPVAVPGWAVRGDEPAGVELSVPAGGRVPLLFVPGVGTT